ncbi:MAG: hypothetical protein ACPGWM_05575 [Flavobacteriales bacterium]
MKHKQLLYFLLLSNAAALFVIGEALYDRGLFQDEENELNTNVKMRLLLLIPFVLSFIYLATQLLKSPNSQESNILDQEDPSFTNEDWD